jgi:thiamine-monophosphate kinase
LGHILETSGVGATLESASIPLSKSFIDVTCAWNEHLTERDWLRLALTAGDDYELCFIAPAAQQTEVAQVLAQFACGFRAVGVIEQTPGLRLRHADGTLLSLVRGGYDHFANDPEGDGI